MPLPICKGLGDRSCRASFWFWLAETAVSRVHFWRALLGYLTHALLFQPWNEKHERGARHKQLSRIVNEISDSHRKPRGTWCHRLAQPATYRQPVCAVSRECDAHVVAVAVLDVVQQVSFHTGRRVSARARASGSPVSGRARVRSASLCLTAPCGSPVNPVRLSGMSFHDTGHTRTSTPNIDMESVICWPAAV